MADADKVIRGWKRCKECNMSPAFGLNQAYLDCEYTIGLYCGRDKLIFETIEVLKSQQEEISRLTGDEQILPVKEVIKGLTLERDYVRGIVEKEQNCDTFNNTKHLLKVYDSAIRLLSGGERDA